MPKVSVTKAVVATLTQNEIILVQLRAMINSIGFGEAVKQMKTDLVFDIEVHLFEDMPLARLRIELDVVQYVKGH